MPELPNVNTGPSQGGGFWNTVGGLLGGYAEGRAAVDLENRRDAINTPDRVDHAHTVAQTANPVSAVASNMSPMQWAMLGIAGLLGVVLVVKLVK